MYVFSFSFFYFFLSTRNILLLSRADLKLCVALYLVCVEVLRPSQNTGVMSSIVSLPNHTFTGQA